jgi:glycosyltransferase involved in cell wall biosynthesis
MNEISLIIPTHNRYWALKITMPHYLKQKNVKEIIVVNDGSNDATESYISNIKKKDSRIIYIKNQKRVGPHRARNIGINVASGNYLLIGEDDVIFQDNYSMVLLNAMRGFDADIVGGRLLFLKNGESLESCISRYENRAAYLSRNIIKEPFSEDFSSKRTGFVLFLHACALFKKNVFNVVRYDENYKYNYFREETDIFLNAKANGFKVLYAGDAVAFHLSTIARARGGCRHFDCDSIALKILGSPRKLASNNLASPILRTVFYQLDIDDCIMKFLNNNYFIDKYFYLLRKELRLHRGKSYYKLAFARHLLREKALFIKNLVRPTS